MALSIRDLIKNFNMKGNSDKNYPILVYTKENKLELPKGRSISIDKNCLYIPVFCHLCGKKLEYGMDFFQVPNDDWEKYVPPPLKFWVLCKPCYDYIKKLFPDGWHKTKLPIYVTIPVFPLENNDLEEECLIIKVLRMKKGSIS